MKFFGALVTLSFAYGTSFAGTIFYVFKNKKFQSIFDKLINSLFFTSNISTIFSIFTLVCSICYLTEEKVTTNKWDNIIMAEFIFFKCIDQQILFFFDFYDNTDIVNATMVITLEKVIWMIIETIIEFFEVKKNILIIVQIISSTALLVLSCFIIRLFGEYLRKKSENENSEENNAK